jgi:hypothetical protein
MLEILAIVWLCNKNKANALARGRKPGGFVGLTIALWFGLEFIGILVGMATEMGLGAYVLGLVLAIIGGVISYVVAKNVRPGDYVAPSTIMAANVTQNAQQLTAPARIDIVRESSMVGAAVKWTFTLNGQELGRLGNGQAMTVYTSLSQNVLVAKDAYGTEITPLMFGAQSGGHAELHFKVNRFIPESSTGLLAADAAQPTAKDSLAQEAAFCIKCGTPIEQGMSFCLKCGAPRAAMPQSTNEIPGAAPFVTDAAPFISAATPSSVPLAPEDRPKRVVWAALTIFGAWVLLLLLQAAIGMGMFFNLPAGFILTDLMLGAGVYLLIRRESKYRLIGGGILLVEALAVPLNIAAMNVASRMLGSIEDLFHYYMIWPNLGCALIAAAIAAGLALLFSSIWRAQLDKKRIYATGWIAAGGAVIFGLLRILILYIPHVGKMLPVPVFINNISGYLIDAAVIGLSVMVFAGITRQSKDRLRLSVWAIVWCSLCSVAMLASLITSIAGGIWAPSLLILMLAALTGFILLLCGQRIGFFLSLIAVSVYLISSFDTSLQQIIMGSFAGVATLISAVIGAANPIITWFSIRRAWMGIGSLNQSAAYRWQPEGEKTVRTFSKVVAIVNLVVGAFFFILPFPFIINDSYEPSMMASMLPGLAVVIFAIFAIISFFGKKSRYHTWLDVLMRVLFWIVCAVIAGALVAAAINA